MGALEFRMLGPLEVRRGGQSVPVTAPRLRALLLLLLLRANEPVAQSELMEQLWNGAPPPSARAAFHNAIHALRRVLGRDVLERRNGGYVLHVGAGCLDLVRFRSLVAEARDAGRHERADKLRDALACWRGPVQAEDGGFAGRELSGLEEERLARLEERIDADLALGGGAGLVPELEQLVTRHGSRERFWAQLMLALYQAGRQADALSAYRRAHDALDRLGLAPGLVLRQLQRAILVQDPALVDPTRHVGSTLERAAMILPRQPREQAESLFEYGMALFRLGEPHHARTTLHAAQRLAWAAGEVTIAERAGLELSWLSLLTDAWKAPEHLAAAERAAELFERLGDERGLALALRHRAHVLRDSGRADEAVGLARRGAALAAKAGDEWQAESCRSVLALSLAMGSAPVPEAITQCEQLAARREWDGRAPHGVWSALVMLYAEAGRDAFSRSMCEELVDTATAAGAHVPLSTALAFGARAAVESGRLAKATAYLRRARVLTEEMPVEQAVNSAELAIVLAWTGAFDEAKVLAVEARACAPSDFVLNVAWRRALGLVSAHRGRPTDALTLTEEACALTRESDDLTLHGQTLEDRATVLLLLSDAAAAQETLQEAALAYDRKQNVAGARRVLARLRATRGRRLA
jgi:DNA-binding SARP family transcriptional activator